MQIKIIAVCAIIFAIVSAVYGCNKCPNEKLPICLDTVSLDANAHKNVFTSGNPKVVKFIKPSCFQFLDMEILRRQINNNPEFDFLFYVNDDNINCRDMLEHFVHDNQLPIVLFIDYDNEYRKANNLSDNIGFTTCIIDENLIQRGVALIGCRFSPFDNVINKVRMQLDL